MYKLDVLDPCDAGARYDSCPAVYILSRLTAICAATLWSIRCIMESIMNIVKLGRKRTVHDICSFVNSSFDESIYICVASIYPTFSHTALFRDLIYTLVCLSKRSSPSRPVLLIHIDQLPRPKFLKRREPAFSCFAFRWTTVFDQAAEARCNGLGPMGSHKSSLKRL